MSDNFKIEITTPGKLIFSGDVTSAQIPGQDGEMGVLAGHSPVISTLKTGLVSTITATGEKKFFVVDGFAEINATQVNILASEAEDLAKITSADVAARISAAEVRLNTAKTEFETRRAQESIEQNQLLLSLLG